LDRKFPFNPGRKREPHREFPPLLNPPSVVRSSLSGDDRNPQEWTLILISKVREKNTSEKPLDHRYLADLDMSSIPLGIRPTFDAIVQTVERGGSVQLHHTSPFLPP